MCRISTPYNNVATHERMDVWTYGRMDVYATSIQVEDKSQITQKLNATAPCNVESTFITIILPASDFMATKK